MACATMKGNKSNVGKYRDWRHTISKEALAGIDLAVDSGNGELYRGLVKWRAAAKRSGKPNPTTEDRRRLYRELEAITWDARETLLNAVYRAMGLFDEEPEEQPAPAVETPLAGPQEALRDAVAAQLKVALDQIMRAVQEGGIEAVKAL